MGVNCCQEIGNEDLIIENIIQEEIMETVKEKDLTYNDYLQMIETEEKTIEELDNDIEAVESELEDVEISIDLAEAERLNQVRAVYEALITTRQGKEVKLEELEERLDERRGYLNSLREEDYIDREAEVKDDMDSLDSAVDTHIEQHYSSDVIRGMTENFNEVDVIEKDGVYSIPNTPYVIGTDGQVLF